MPSKYRLDENLGVVSPDSNSISNVFIIVGNMRNMEQNDTSMMVSK